MQRESLATFVIAMVIVSGAMGAISWKAGPAPFMVTPSTITTTEYIPCAANLTQTTTTMSGNTNASAEFSNFGPILGNFSSITILLYGRGPNGASSERDSVAVLNRTSTFHGTNYLVNVTAKEVGPNVTTETSGGITTTITGANLTLSGYDLAYVRSNGSVISTLKTAGNFSSTLLPLWVLIPLVPLGLQGIAIHHPAVNSTTISMGGINMYVNNYDFPSEVLYSNSEACLGQPASNVVATLTDFQLQLGIVPGTHFALVTRYSYSGVVSPTSSSPPTRFNVVMTVVSFTVANEP